jgi:hypothetical protein
MFTGGRCKALFLANFAALRDNHLTPRRQERKGLISSPKEIPPNFAFYSISFFLATFAPLREDSVIFMPLSTEC